MATNSFKVVHDEIREVAVSNENLPGVSKIIIKRRAPKDGSKNVVKYDVQPVLKLEGGGEIPLNRSLQVLFRTPVYVRPPQVQDENTKEWSTDPTFPAKFTEKEFTRALEHEVAAALKLQVKEG